MTLDRRFHHQVLLGFHHPVKYFIYRKKTQEVEVEVVG